MIEPFFRKPTTAHEWRLRAERLKQQIDRLSIDELLRGGPIDETSHAGVGHRYDPNQPRVPAGHPDGGQWTSKGGHEAWLDRIVLSDTSPDNEWQPGAQYANRGRSSRGGPLSQASPTQLFRLSKAQAEAREAIQRVQEIEPAWQPQPSAYQSVEGMIRAYQGEAREANTRYIELTYLTGPGRFAVESIPSTSTGRLRRGEQREINQFGRIHGCHTCGKLDPGTRSGNHIGDHQLPTALNQLGRPQRRYPQCLHCSNVQGGKVRALMKKRGR